MAMMHQVIAVIILLFLIRIKFFIVNLFGSYIIHENVVEASSYLNCKIEAFINLPELEVQYFHL